MTQNQNIKTSSKSGIKRGLLFLFSIGLFSLISISGIYAQNKTGDNGNGQSKPTTKTDSLKFQNRTENTGIWNPSGENIFYSGGRVGIGTDSPARILHMVDEMAMLRVDRNHPSGHDPALLLVNKLTTGEVLRSWMLTGGKNGFSIADYGNKTGGSNFTKVFQITPERLTVLGDVTSPTEKLEIAGNVKSDASVLRANNGGSLKIEFNNSANKVRFRYLDPEGVGSNLMFLETDGDVEVSNDLKVSRNLSAESVIVSYGLNINGATIFNDPVEDDLYFDAPTGVHELFFRGYNVQLTEGNVTAQSFVGAGDDLTVGGTKLSTLLSGGGTGSSVWNSATNGQISYAGGDVLIGQPTAKQQLTLHGDLVANRMAVAANPDNFTAWPDYVFEKDYNLMSINQLDKFLKKEKHLPEVPSAAQIANEGFNLEKMDATLLKKIEELTLYIIEQNKRIEQLESKMATQK